MKIGLCENLSRTFAQQKQKVDKFAVSIKENEFLIGHLPKENAGRFAKTIFKHMTYAEISGIPEIWKKCTRKTFVIHKSEEK